MADEKRTGSPDGGGHARLGRYTLEQRIGQGGMAEVWLARSAGPHGFEKRVVIKRIKRQLSASPKFVEMFLREGKLLASLDHPNIVRIIDLGEEQGEYFLALEYLAGISLRELAERLWSAGESLPIESVLAIVADAVLGLSHAHKLKDETGADARLVHRDVSPDNIFVTTTGTTKLLDFGIAKRDGQDPLTEVGELKGKVPYMSPEQLRGETVDGRSDLFSLGIVLYWLLSGRRPFDGANDLLTMKAILEAAARPLRDRNPEVPQSVENVVMRLLAPHRGERFQTAAALHGALTSILFRLAPGASTAQKLVARATPLVTPELEVMPKHPAAVTTVQWPELAEHSTEQLRRRGHSRNKDEPTREGPPGFPSLVQSETGSAVDPLAPRDHAGVDAMAAPFDGATEPSLNKAGLLHEPPPPKEPAAPFSPVPISYGGDVENLALVEATDVVALEDETRVEPREPKSGSRSLDTVVGSPVDSDTRPAQPDLHAMRAEAPPVRPPMQAGRAAPATQDEPPLIAAVASSDSFGRIPVTSMEEKSFFSVSDLSASPALPPQAPAAPLPALAQPLNDVVAAPRRRGPLLAAGAALLAVVAVVGWMLTRNAPPAANTADAGAAVAPPDAGTAPAAVLALVPTDGGPAVDAGMARTVDAGPAPASVAASTPDAGTVAAAPPVRTVNLRGAPRIEWRDIDGTVLGRGKISVPLAASVTKLLAVDTKRACTTVVAIAPTQTAADYALLPKRQLVLRAEKGSTIMLGDERLGKSPQRARVTLGTCQVRVDKRPKKARLVEVTFDADTPTVVDLTKKTR